MGGRGDSQDAKELVREWSDAVQAGREFSHDPTAARALRATIKDGRSEGSGEGGDAVHIGGWDAHTSHVVQ